MKNKLLLVLTLILTTHYGLAQDEYEYLEVKGPVKQIISIKTINDNSQLRYGNQKVGGNQTKSIQWYNEDGRIAEDADYDYIENLLGGVVYIYDSIGTSYTRRNYDKSGNIEADYCRFTCDASNKPLLFKWYKNDSVYMADSMIYNTQGKLIHKYSKFRHPEYILSEKHAYDSLGRLTKLSYIENGEEESGYEVNYKKDGNLEKVYFNKDSKTSSKELYLYNNEKQLVKIKDTNSSMNFSNFDKYGNWLALSSDQFFTEMNITINTTTTRIIEYYE